MKEAPPIQIGTPSELLIQQFHRSYEEIANLAETRIEPAEFYRAIVTHAQAGIKASAAAFWLGTAAGDLQCAHQIHLDAVFSDDAEPNGHRRLLQTYLQSPRLLVLPPKHEVNYQTGEEPVLDNPTDRYLWLAPVSIEKRAVGVIELVLQNAEPPAIQAARLQFLSGLAHQASIFLRNLRIWRADDDRKLWTRIHEFGRQIHGSLDLVKVAYAVANEGARLVGCDRLSVVSCGWRPKVEAVSGLEVVDQRSNQIRHLASLGKAVCAGNQRLEFYGVPDETLSPELRRLLDRYLDEQPGKLLVVEPLPNRSGRNETRLRFALVMECFDGKSDRNTLVARLQHVGEQSAAALANAAEVRSIPLRWLWQPLLRLKKNFRSQRGTALLWLLAVFVAACSAFFLPPLSFEIGRFGETVAEEASLPLSRGGRPGGLFSARVGHGCSRH
ncbi:MAG: hypothetical protein KatS3mg105_1832 [Gemmatales bacterium]|nr:MAG: hypothetical protein KatS3mg105_1832 [Gemmatales bacterium]